jgi:hypothetical protein
VAKTLGMQASSGGLACQDALVVLIMLVMSEFVAKQIKLREKK